uniref:Uncharacterized protein n=1 Tax=Neogobius melanostomus TaxID=47308 RepID=A0A8C6S6U6_9GOBI
MRTCLVFVRALSHTKRPKMLLAFGLSQYIPIAPNRGEAATGKSFGDKDFRSALENGILLCELLSAIKPGLVKKINRLPTPIAGFRY